MSEYLTYLEIEDYKIFQDTEDYAFTQDSVFLANLAKIGKNDTVLDLGTGCGIVAFLIAIKKNAKKVVGLELQEKMAKMAQKSVNINNLEDKVEIVCGDVKNATSLLGYEKFDKIVCNPPYFENNFDIIPENRTEFYKGINKNRSISRSENSATLEHFIKSAKEVLKFGGDFTMVHKMERMVDVLALLRQNNLEPKEIYFIYPKFSKNVDTFIVRARKGGKAGLLNHSIIVLDESGQMTKEAKELYL